jgi:hypothetical protein
MSCVSTSFSIFFTAINVCKFDAYFFMLTTFVWYSVSSFCFSSSIQKFGEVVVESKPCEINLVRKKNKQAQMMRSELLSPMSVQNIKLNLKQKINIKGSVSSIPR